MSSPYTRREKLAGLFLILGLLMIFAWAVLVGGGQDWFRSYNYYYALYNEGYGLSPGVKVKFLRTDVGLVTRLELTENNKVKVHMSILAEYADRVKSDSQAAIASPTFIGSEYIDIIPGSARTEPVPRGGQIPAKERKSLEDYVRDLRLDTMLARVEAIMINVDSLTHQLQDPSGPLLGTMSNVRKLTSTVAAGEGTLGRLTMDETTAMEINRILTDIQATTDNIAMLSAKLNDSVPDIINRLEAITVQVELATRSAPEIGRGARESLRSVNQVLDSAKRNFLIRPNLTQDPEPESLTYPVRQK
ncbi:hypothetical protein C4J81_01680 [Deltaproteobacteria bacterium Smac51]|nr:hypothetical protein C4J81_01680 [Deltaproteobacteria bacterium Smac51]